MCYFTLIIFSDIFRWSSYRPGIYIILIDVIIQVNFFCNHFFLWLISFFFTGYFLFWSQFFNAFSVNRLRNGINNSRFLLAFSRKLLMTLAFLAFPRMLTSIKTCLRHLIIVNFILFDFNCHWQAIQLIIFLKTAFCFCFWFALWLILTIGSIFLVFLFIHWI